MCFGRKTTEVKRPSKHFISRVCTSECLITVDVDLDHLAEVVFVRFLHCEVTFSTSALGSDHLTYSWAGNRLCV